MSEGRKTNTTPIHNIIEYLKHRCDTSGYFESNTQDLLKELNIRDINLDSFSSTVSGENKKYKYKIGFKNKRDIIYARKITDKTLRDENTQQDDSDIEAYKRTIKELDGHLHAGSERYFHYMTVKISSKKKLFTGCMTEDEYKSFINTLTDIENAYNDKDVETFTIEGTGFRLEKVSDITDGYRIVDIKYTRTRTVPLNAIKNNLPKSFEYIYDVISTMKSHSNIEGYKKALYEEQNHICRICGKPMNIDHEILELDHILPLAYFGTSDIQNIQLVHRHCNRKKSDYVGNIILIIKNYSEGE